ncbi:NAD-dependent epimerase/dehydratase family protein [Silicimonas sp. MF1-12-2]|uniref:NAD-dependent epimerase/dehydratase family protein n=1 Tax=Silicimonas sp. MF1-12-2 TaxID=3384793 RepID=UPI0039B642B2
MKFLVTGGSGFLGINLIRHLLARDMTVRSLDIVPFVYPETDEIDHINADIRDGKTLRTALEGIDVVVHGAAALPLYRPEEILDVDVNGTRELLEAAVDTGVKRIVHISSTAVYGVPDHHPLVENDPMTGVGPYGEAKVRAEQICAEYRDRGLCLCILRPKSFVGPERLGIFELLFEFASQGRNFPVLGTGSNRYQLLDVEDLCSAIFIGATGPADQANDVFNVGAAEFGTIRDDFQAVLDRAGFGKRIVSLPAKPTRVALRILETMRLSPIYPWIYETVARDSYVSIDKIRTKLGFSPRYSNRDALVRNYDWYVANRHRISAAAGTSHRVPWKRGALRLAEMFF